MVVKCIFGFLVNDCVSMDSYDWKRENLNISHIDIYQEKQHISKEVK
jgi:hypothetical protein